jgi:hypothetical protein
VVATAPCRALRAATSTPTLRRAAAQPRPPPGRGRRPHGSALGSRPPSFGEDDRGTSTSPPSRAGLPPRSPPAGRCG